MADLPPPAYKSSEVSSAVNRAKCAKDPLIMRIGAAIKKAAKVGEFSIFVEVNKTESTSCVWTFVQDELGYKAYDFDKDGGKYLRVYWSK